MARTEAKAATAAAGLLSYFLGIGEEGLLTADDELRLAEAIARMEAPARSCLAATGRQLAVYIASDCHGRDVAFDDPAGSRNLGLASPIAGT
jgi:hypothetical protein